MTKRRTAGAVGFSRRDALRLGAGASLGALSFLSRGIVSPDLSAQTPPAGGPPAPNPDFPQVPSWNTELRELAPNVYAYIQAGGPGRDNVSVSNAGIIVGDDGVMVIDTLTAPLHAKNFIAAIRKVTDKPFRHVINTHHHSDHVNGNQYFMPAEIVAHPYCREEVLKMVAGPALWPKREGWADGTEPRQIVPPVTTFDTRMTYHYGRTVVELIFMGPAHTYGDIVAYLPQHRILFAGDIAFYYVAPFAQNAHVSKWLETIDRIMAMDVQTIVPGHGPIGGKNELAEMGEYFVVLKREARPRFDAGMSAGRAAADIRMGKFENWIGPERIVMDTVRLYAEFSGTLVPSVDVEGNRKATEEYEAVRASRR
jgi:cyclase